MGCLFVLMAGIFPRLALVIVWIARPTMVDRAFDSWLWPLLGLVFEIYEPPSQAIIDPDVRHPLDGGWPQRLGLVLGGDRRPARPRALGIGCGLATYDRQGVAVGRSAGAPTSLEFGRQPPSRSRSQVMSAD